MYDEIWLTKPNSDTQAACPTIDMPPQSIRLIVAAVSLQQNTGKRSFQLRNPQSDELYGDGAFFAEDEITLARKGRLTRKRDSQGPSGRHQIFTSQTDRSDPIVNEG